MCAVNMSFLMEHSKRSLGGCFISAVDMYVPRTGTATKFFSHYHDFLEGYCSPNVISNVIKKELNLIRMRMLWTMIMLFVLSLDHLD